MARTFTFGPQGISATAPISNFFSFDSLLEGLFIHPGNHENFVALHILCNSRYQSPGCKVDCYFGWNLHWLILP